MEIPASITKLVAGGGALAVATAAVAGQVPLPVDIALPEGHTVAEVLYLAMGAFMLAQIRVLNKKADEKPAEVSGESAPVGKSLQSQLDSIANGVKEVTDQLTEHRIEFAAFQGNVEGRLANLERRR